MYTGTLFLTEIHPTVYSYIYSAMVCVCSCSKYLYLGSGVQNLKSRDRFSKSETDPSTSNKFTN